MKANEINCLDIIHQLAKLHSNIEEFSFNSHHAYKLLQERIDTEGELKSSYTKALTIRETYSFPFWDSFNVSLFHTKLEDLSFLREVKFHNKIKKTYSITRATVANFLVDQQAVDMYLTFCSKVTFADGKIKHFPLLDFHIPVSAANENICIGVLKALKLKGFLLDSGKSYHFYGKELLEQEELISLLATALLFAPIIDRAWVAHQLIERKCSLRISKKYERLPLKIRSI
ncbi:hypothetical protein [Mucilaginibacter sp.]|uniref:primase 1D-like protein n=1 Tax=Mucilaginibacter sp. TaxID=1882438 RepID=UPI0035BBC82F